MKRRILIWMLAFGAIAAAMPGTAMQAEAAIDTNTRVIGDANNSEEFDIVDLIRMKRYLSKDIANIEEMGDMNIDGVVDEADLVLCIKGLLTYTVDMKLADSTTNDMEAVNMKQTGNQIVITMENTSDIWESASGSKVNVSIETATGVTTMSVEFHRVGSEGRRDCTIALPDGASSVTITGVEIPLYWSVPVE